MKLDQNLNNAEIISLIVGVNDRNLFVFRQYLGIDISIYGSEIITNANEEQRKLLEAIFMVLIQLAENKIVITERDVMYVIKLAEQNELDGVLELYKNSKPIITNSFGKTISAKTFNQKQYINAVILNNLTFGVGPAGTGKTYLAVAMAVAALKSGEVKKLILTRPAVEAGETLGFLPGDLKDKIDPYLIPLYDALEEMLGVRAIKELIEKGIIEIAPLAYMRGRTLDNAFIILDEAQNTTKTQMKMFLTRLGFSSKMVVTGDPRQTDLPKGQQSGLAEAIMLLDNMSDIKIIKFAKVDVIRHPIVQRILERYEADES